MQCKDSDVFALESSVEKILNKGDWKGLKEIENELSVSDENNYKSWLSRKKDQFQNEQSEELFYKDLMDRMCSLFPMKYRKSEEAASVKYARNIGHND